MAAEELTEEEFLRFRDFIYSKAGIRIPEIKRTLLSNRIRRRLRAGSHADFRTYYDFLTSLSGREELSGFLDAVTTNETSFFRTEKHFEWFAGEFISEALQLQQRGLRDRSLRIWSAACSSGEEACSIAVCLLRNQLRLRDWTLQIVGTDLSEAAVEAARAGRYRARTMELLSAADRRRYFRSCGDDEWEVRSSVRELISWQTHNLLDPMRLPPFDCIWIRNVLIYFDRESKRRVIANLVRALKPGGYLVVGPSEGIYDMLEMLKKHSPFLFQKE